MFTLPPKATHELRQNLRQSGNRAVKPEDLWTLDCYERDGIWYLPNHTVMPRQDIARQSYRYRMNMTRKLFQQRQKGLA